MRVAIVYGKFYSSTKEDFAYLQAGLARCDELIILIGHSDRQATIATHINLMKFTDYIMLLKDNETYEDCLGRLVGFRDQSPKENINLIWLNNRSEQLENIKFLCETNGVFYIEFP